MTWETLVKKAKELGYERITKYSIRKNGIIFFDDGDILVEYDVYGLVSGETTVSTKRTPDQMYQIMLALED